jgi:TolB protein
MTTPSLGSFESNTDVGVVLPRAGGVEHVAGTYRITGGGANMWGREDAFHFLWRRWTGDVTLQADIEFVGAGSEPHRKAVLMIRQDLTPGSAYADAALHADGLTSLQFRSSAGGETRDTRANLKGAVRLVIERRGQRFTVLAGLPGQTLVPCGPEIVELNGPVYVGLGVCSHSESQLETVVFQNVSVQRPRHINAAQHRSHIAIYDLASRSSRVVYSGEGVIEAPNWSRDGKFLLVNTKGDLFRLPLGSPNPQLERLPLSPGSYNCNNDHDLSPDGKLLAFSASSPATAKSQVWVARADGSSVKLITPKAPSYFHGWSRDGHFLAFVAERGDGRYELYRVPAEGGLEERLTTSGGYDDGPEYSPDGRWIYFNSNRGGRWNLWRMPLDGAGALDARAEQVTRDEPEDWFPHFSPDGQWLVWLSFPPGTEGHNDRMPGMQLRLARAPGAAPEAQGIEVLSDFFGGQGTLNVNSWSPDSKQFGYVIYEPA